MSYSDSESGDDYSYTYNADGIRTSKTVNGVKHTYHLSGTQILSEEWTDRWNRHVMVYIYDAAGQPIGMTHFQDGTLVDTYLYEKNIQGDVVAVYDYAGDLVVRYAYNAWGAVSETEYGSEYDESSFAVECNPFRYRGYYYDTETDLYYLNSRYYDPAVGRFLNADGYINANGDLIGFNMFAYCSNNPVMGYDPDGKWTYSFGVNFSSFLIGGATYSVSASLDSSGNIAIQTSKADLFRECSGATLGPAAVGISLFGSFTILDTVDELNGPALSVGISGIKKSYGADVLFSASDPDLKFLGGGVSVGTGVGVDVHTTVSITQTHAKVNIIDIGKKLKKTWNRFVEWVRD